MFELLARKGAFYVLEKIEELGGTARFKDLYRDFPGTPTLLSKRVKELRKLGLVEKTLVNGEYIGYKLTEKGRKALKLLRELENLLNP